MKIIAFDGLPGSGKTSISHSIAEILDLPHLCMQYGLANKLKSVLLLNCEIQKYKDVPLTMYRMTEFIIACTDTYKHVRNIETLRSSGEKIVAVSDEFFWYFGNMELCSSILKEILSITDIQPYVFFLDIPIELSARRKNEREARSLRYNVDADTFNVSDELRETHEREINLFTEIYPKLFDFPIIKIDATQTQDKVIENIVDEIVNLEILE